MLAHSSRDLRSTFVTGLQNAHALEQQALALIDRQLDRLVHYPDVADRLKCSACGSQQISTRPDWMERPGWLC